MNTPSNKTLKLHSILNATQYQDLPTLRLVTCGSVDDGKSTLLGRFLYETNHIFLDQWHAALKNNSHFTGSGEEQKNTALENFDWSTLIDGLEAEKEQKITVDVAHRYFRTSRQIYILSDCPGHFQFTRNMATASSRADCALLVVDIRKGLRQQTIRHSRILNLMGVENIFLIINKMDLVNYSQDSYDHLVDEYKKTLLSHRIEFKKIIAIPVSALLGENLVSKSKLMPWYQGESILQSLENLPPTPGGLQNVEQPFLMSVQWVNHPHQDFRGYCGRISSGTIKLQDRIRILPGDLDGTVSGIFKGFSTVTSAKKGDSICLTFFEDIDAPRGSLLSSPKNPPPLCDEFEAEIIWLNTHPLQRGKTYTFRSGCKEVSGVFNEIISVEDIDLGIHLTADTVVHNEIARVHVKCHDALPLDTFANCQPLGRMIVVDKHEYQTLAAMIVKKVFPKNTSIASIDSNVLPNRAVKNILTHPICLWLTGLPGAGKTTLAYVIEKKFKSLQVPVCILDGDQIRKNLNSDLGFSDKDRIENIRRIIELARILVDAGLFTVVSTLSPFRSMRQSARERFGANEFFEVYLNTPQHVCESRDSKGNYQKARQGLIEQFTGISSPYEPPTNPDLTINMEHLTPEEGYAKIVHFIKNHSA